MRQTKVFFTTFLLSCTVMLCAFTGLHRLIDYRNAKSVGENQTNIPILTPDHNDSKTTLIVFDADSNRFFFLLKLNALQNKVSLACIPSTFKLSSANRTLGESMDYAGIMQCVEDLSTQFDINIDYHLLCDEASLTALISSFAPLSISEIENLPQSIESYLLKGANFIDPQNLAGIVAMAAPALDNDTGLSFLTSAAIKLTENNLHLIRDKSLDGIKDNFSRLTSNLNTENLDRLKRITNFLLSNPVTYESAVISDPDTVQSEIDRLFKQ